jgi:hypothetical protein
MNNTIKIKNINLEVEDGFSFYDNGNILAIFKPFTYKQFSFPRFRESSHQIESFFNAINEDRILNIETIDNKLFYIIAKANEETFKAYKALFNIYIYLPNNEIIEFRTWSNFNIYSHCIDYKDKCYNNYKKSGYVVYKQL